MMNVETQNKTVGTTTHSQYNFSIKTQSCGPLPIRMLEITLNPIKCISTSSGKYIGLTFHTAHIGRRNFFMYSLLAYFKIEKKIVTLFNVAYLSIDILYPAACTFLRNM